MKTIRLTAILFFFPLAFYGQTLTGLWMGAISNDSNTIRKDQSFEITLTQYKDKVYGYSRSTFIVNDTLFYIVKRVTGTIRGDVCEVKDDDIISYNFRGRLDKGVKMISTFHLDHQDSIWKMDGEWKTNKTKKFYAVSGKIDLKQEKDLEKSKLFPHLEELNLANEMPFYKESKKAEMVATTTKQPQKETKNEPIAREIKQTNPATPAQETIASSSKEQNVQKKPPSKNAMEETRRAEPNNDNTAIKDNRKDSFAVTHPASNPVREGTLANDPKKQTAIREEKPAEKEQQPTGESIAAAKPTDQKKEPVVQPPVPETKKQEPPVVLTNAGEKERGLAEVNIPANKPTIPAAAQVSERKVAPPQIVNFKSDSLELALYDNGEVDGDTVSVLLNGEIILARQGLKASAIRKTIYVTRGTGDSLTLVLYAENLGKYPPNTGLLVVHDGDETYQLRFSADLQQNAAVIFRRKRQ